MDMRRWADTASLPREVILTWKNGAYYVSEPNFLGEGESVRLRVEEQPDDYEGESVDCKWDDYPAIDTRISEQG
jgi:hypothetical protein